MDVYLHNEEDLKFHRLMASNFDISQGLADKNVIFILISARSAHLRSFNGETKWPQRER